MSERVVVVDWPQIAKRGETLFPGALVVYANGSLPMEALETDDCIIVSMDAERLTDFCQQVVAASCRLVRYSTDDISAFTTREEVVQWHQQGGLAEYKGSSIPSPARQVQKPVKPIPPGATNEALTEPVGAGLDDEPPRWMDEIPDDLDAAQRSIRTASALKKHAFAESGEYEWVDPADFWGARPLAPFQAQWILPTIRPFVSNLSAMVGCDPGITYLQALAFASGCLTDDIRVRVRPSQDWAEAARLWACVVGDSGDGKSPSMKGIMREAGSLSMEVAQRSREKLSGYKDEFDLYEMQRKAWLTKRQKDEPAGMRPIAPAKPVNEMLYFNGTTAEGLLEQQEATTRGAMCYADEFLSWLMSMDQYKSGGKGSDRQFWLSAWDGAEFIGILVGKLRTIPNTGVSIIGGSQPDAIRRAAIKLNLDSDGLMQRVLVYNSTGPANEESEQPADRSAISEWRTILHTLYAMKPHLDHCIFSDEAHTIRRQATDWITHMRGIPQFPAGARQALSKWRAYLPRIALTMHAIECAAAGREVITATIGRDTVALAWDYMRDCLWPHMLHFYSTLDQYGDEDKSVRTFAEFVLARNIRTIKPHKLNSAWGNYKRSLTIQQWKEFWVRVEGAGWARPIGQTIRSSGLSSEYEINPRAFDGRFEDQIISAQVAVEKYRAAQHPEFLKRQGREPGED